MDNMTADIEQLLAELVRIAAQIAALANTTSTSASDDSDSPTSTANRLSLAATIIAVAAFLVAFLQAILEYSSAGESARRKCDLAAIGPFSKHVHKKWSFRHWRRKFYYPVLNQDFSLNSVNYRGFIDVLMFLGGKLHISLPLTLWDIGLFSPIHRREEVDLQSRPRATWAQLLSIGSFEATRLINPKVYLDVDSIPGSVDVPPQLFDLIILGKLTLMMGFGIITLDVQHGEFQAIGELGSISTETLMGFGKLLRFQAYTEKQGHSNFLLYSHLWRKEACGLAKGHFTPHAYLPGKKSLIKEEYLSHISIEANESIKGLRENIQSNTRTDDVYDIINTSPNKNMEELIENFDPRAWERSLRGRDSSSTPIYDAANLLKSQIILLDISMFFLLDAMNNTYAPHMDFIEDYNPWRQFGNAPATFTEYVLKAVLESAPNSASDKPELFSNLDLALPIDLSICPAAQDIYQRLVSQIAYFLRLRVVLFGAYLMILPDNTIILEAERSLGSRRILLPMI
ncbi:hypothetical protein GQX73_g7909 [Xylaria multiplex]|uniref:Uncharacterized protein n=1 Tax=Xylaria multiplex TaxID=323545 RepID=A0A7C8N0Z2_9PEZI|nr:hypothetical protein GQX73_g7909 [Xylaria multiplex]